MAALHKYGYGYRYGLGARAAGGAAFDFYVDSVNGDEANAGTSLALAKETLTAADALMTTGSRLALVAGSSWEEALDISSITANTVGVAGSGSRPIIDGSVAVTVWTAEGTANVWQATVDHNGSGNDRLVVYEDGVPLSRVADVATCSSTAGSFVGLRATDSDPWTVKIHATGSGDPNSNGLAYRAGARRYSILTATGSTVTGPLEVRRAIARNGSIEMGTGSTMRQVLSLDGTKHNTFIASGTIEDCIAIDNDGVTSYEPTSTLFVSYMNDPTGEEVTYRRCGAILTRGQVGTFAWYAHSTSASLLYDTVTMEQCWAVGTSGQWIGVPSGGANGLANNIARAIYVYNGVNCMGGATNQYNLYTGTAAGYGPTNLQYSFTANDCVCYYPQGSNAGNANAIWRATNDFTGVWTNCAWAFGAAGSNGTNDMMTRSGTRTGSLECNYNIFFNGNNHINLPANITYTGDYNIFVVDTRFSSAQFGSVFNNTAYTTLAAWQAATSADTNSVYALKADQTAGNANALWLAYAEAAGGTDLTTIGPAVGDFRINPSARVYGSDNVARTGVFADDTTPITNAGPQNHWDWNTRSVVSGPPTGFPAVPDTLAESRTYIDNPAAWDFYP